MLRRPNSYLLAPMFLFVLESIVLGRPLALNPLLKSMSEKKDAPGLRKLVLSSAEEEKGKYCRSTPCVLHTLSRLCRWSFRLGSRSAEKIAIKWKKSYPEIAGWVRTRLSFAILRATTLCLRGSRTKWRSGAAIDDGAGLPDVEY